eukprot:CAMPEP_0174341218 /NCGR_PEP_ID=MMETSP0810-20121108/25244_1 /TAXON_ID=73025 ORGANISM="Eutreptiella gymnastica-like, Strain CCMP1594" /NCGR_SAMPLE_ID=MMETSP0810 /ASSEMBLY_ACC=CAM_ASM_000659 /LENGTH=61 /DNA_ID=CAMNT_0015462739 /DNA_START=72 /DNA_END=257 /DNA_ORIENTATION=+
MRPAPQTLAELALDQLGTRMGWVHFVLAGAQTRHYIALAVLGSPELEEPGRKAWIVTTGRG